MNLPGNNPNHNDISGHILSRGLTGVRDPFTTRLEQALRETVKRRDAKAKSSPGKIIMKDGKYVDGRDSGQKV